MATFAVTKALEEAGKDVVVVTPENKGQILLAEREPYIINRLSPLMAINEGKIKVIDTVTGEIFEFKNTKDAGLLKMFSTCAITQCLKTGNKTRIKILVLFNEFKRW